MISKLRTSLRFSLVVLLVCCACTGLLIGLGCGGGGGGGGSSVSSVSLLNSLTGRVLVERSPASVRTAGLTEGVKGAEVWIEDLSDDPRFRTVTGEDGTYVFAGVPEGSHRIVAKTVITGSDGKSLVMKQRSNGVSIPVGADTTIADNIFLEPAKNYVTGALKDETGRFLPYGTALSLWGETFRTGRNGEFVTPTLPDSINEGTILVRMTTGGYAVVRAPFVSDIAPARVDYEIGMTGREENRPPSGVLIPRNAITVASKTPTGGSLTISASGFDPDSGDAYQLTYQWSTTLGTLENGTGALQKIFRAPDHTGIATISVVVTDPFGATGSIYLPILIGINSPSDADTTSPKATLAALATATWDGAPFQVRVTFSETVFGFDKTDLTVTNGTVSSIATVTAGTAYLATIAPGTFGTVTVGLSAGVVADLGGNRNLAATSVSITHGTLLNEGNQLLAFAFTLADNPGTGLTADVRATIDRTSRNVAMNVPFGTILKDLVSTFTVSLRATVKVGSVVQVSGKTANDFTAPLTYAVTAENGTSVNYIVTVHTAPGIMALFPANKAVNVNRSADFGVIFSKNVLKGTGNIVIRNVTDDMTAQTIDVTSANVTIAGNIASISHAPLETKKYAVRIANTCFVDAVGNAFAGITNDTAWSFTVNAEAPVATFSVVASPRATPAGTVKLTFSKIVTGVDGSDLALTRNDAPVALAPGLLAGSGASYIIDLNGVTTADGAYRLTLKTVGSDIVDAAGNDVSNVASIAWIMDITPPATPTAVVLAPVGGTIVTNILNTTNKNLTAQATIVAGDAAGGTAELLFNGASLSPTVMDTTIAAADTSVTFDLGLAGNDALKAKFPAGGTFGVRLTDAVGNTSVTTVGNPVITVDYVVPVVSAPTNDPQTLGIGETSYSTVQTNETGRIYLVRSGVGAATQAQIDTAVIGGQAFLAKDAAAANTPYNVTVHAGVADGQYDIVAADAAGNVSAVVPGWLTVDSTGPTPPTAVTLVPVDGTIVPGMLNTTHTNLMAVATILPGEATGGEAELLLNGASFTPRVRDANIAAGDTAVTFNFGASDNGDVQAMFPTSGVVSVRLTDAAGNSSVSFVGNPTITVDYLVPTVSAPTNVAQTLKSGDSSVSTVQMNEAGTIYLSKHGEPAATLAQITAAISANKTFAGKTGAAANTPYPVTLPAGLLDGVYDLVAADVAGNVSSVVPGWLTVDNTVPSAPTGVTLTPVGDTIVANTLNTTITKLTAQATITAGEATGGTAELLLDGAPFSTRVRDTGIAAGDTTVTFDFGASDNGDVQAKFPSGGVLSVRLSDIAGNISESIVGNPTIAVDYVVPVVSAPDNTPQRLRSAAASTSTVRSTEAGDIYFVKHAEPAATKAQITTVVTAGKAFLGVTAATGGTTYPVTVAAGISDGLYDIVAIDTAGNVSAVLPGWLTVDNTLPTVTKLGNGLASVILAAGESSSIVFSEPLSAASKNDIVTAVKTVAANAVCAWTTDATLQITGGPGGTMFATDVISDISDIAGNISSALILIDTADDTTPPTVTKLGDGTIDVHIAQKPVSMNLVFSEALSIAGKSAVEAALTAGANNVPSYSWTGDTTLTITGADVAAGTTFVNDVIANVSDVAGNTAMGLLLVDSSGDETPPADPTINAVTTPTNVTPQVISGTRPADATIVLVNGSSVGVTYPDGTTWQYSMALNNGANAISVKSRDAAGNESNAVTSNIDYDNVAPADPTINAVTTPTNVTRLCNISSVNS